MQINPYIFFEGRCDEALAFYRTALGAEVKELMRFKEAPDQSMISPGAAEKVMHASVTIAGNTVWMSDGRCQGRPNFSGFALTLQPQTEAEADRLFAALADGGTVQMPLAKTFFSPRFGMVADKFGVPWMVVVMP
jgi:PhnB protein